MTTREILDRTAKIMTANTVFGPAHTQDGITVIPAAIVRGGGGGGGGTRNGEESGDGGGFGLNARPAGALTIKDGEVAWKVPFDINRVIVGGQLVAVAYFVFAWLTERAKAQTLRSLTTDRS